MGLILQLSQAAKIIENSKLLLVEKFEKAAEMFERYILLPGLARIDLCLMPLIVELLYIFSLPCTVELRELFLSIMDQGSGRKFPETCRSNPSD